jgi:hypothetical protein
VEAFAAALQAARVGDPMDTATQLGPIALERQRDRVLEYVGLGQAEGAVAPFSIPPTSATAAPVSRFDTKRSELKTERPAPADAAPIRPIATQAATAQILELAAMRLAPKTSEQAAAPEATAQRAGTANHAERAVGPAKKATSPADEPVATTTTTQPAPLPPTLVDPQAPVLRPAEAQLAAQPALAPLAPALEDPSLRVVMLPNVARLSIETQDSGALNLQLKVNDGVTDVRASGPAASLIEARQGELRLALAHEGLALGHFDLTQSDHRGAQHHRFESPEDREPTPHRHVATRSHEPSNSTTTTRADGRLSVKA